jgi:CheY-like chemotaxis protein
MNSESRLMRHRVRTVLLLGSRYDAYIMKEAGFADPGECPETGLGIEASFIRAESADHALEVVQGGRVDLVLSSLRLKREDPFEVVEKVKKADSNVPAVLVTSDPSFHGPLSEGPQIAPFDEVFSWHGETQLLRAVVMAVEDRLNADHDLVEGGVQLILLVEDEPALYSRYLPMVYEEICDHVRDLLPDQTLNVERTRELARTKVLLARSYEEALILLTRYGQSVCGVLSDLQFPKDGRKIDPQAGLHLARYTKYLRASIPVVIQSRDRSMEAQAHHAGAFFIWKDSDNLLRKLRTIMNDYFGFGDFVFRHPDEGEAGRASDLFELAALMKAVPIEVFRFHASREHFSTWLFIHGEHELARGLRAMRSTSEATRAAATRMIERTLELRSNRLE